jgi:hypothetical protein
MTIPLLPLTMVPVRGLVDCRPDGFVAHMRFTKESFVSSSRSRPFTTLEQARRYVDEHGPRVLVQR